jgi:hypothetical protein
MMVLGRIGPSVHLSPLAGRGRIASPDAIRVRGILRESVCMESPPHPKPSLRFGFDLSPQAGRGEHEPPRPKFITL